MHLFGLIHVDWSPTGLDHFQHVANLAISNSARLHVEHPTSPPSRFIHENDIFQEQHTVFYELLMYIYIYIHIYIYIYIYIYMLCITLP